MAKKFSLKAKFDTEGGISLKPPSSDATPTKKPLLSKSAAAAAVAMELDTNPPPKVGFLSGLKSVVGLGNSTSAAATTTTTQEKKAVAAEEEEEDNKKEQDDIETETDERDPESNTSMDTKGDDNKDTAAKVAEKLVAPAAAAEEEEEAKKDEKPKKKKAVSVKVKTKTKAKGGKGLGKAAKTGPKRHQTDKNGKKSNVEAALSRTVVKRLHYRSHKIDKDGNIVLIKRSMGIYNDIRERLKEYLTPIIKDMCTYVEHARMKTVCEDHAHQALKRHGKPLWGSMEGGDTTSRKSKKSAKEGGESKKKKAKVVSAEEAVKALSAGAPAPMEVVSPSASE